MKGKKFIVSALVATMVGAPVAVLNSATSAFADNNTVNEDANTYTVVGPSASVKNDYKKSAKLGEKVTVPTVTSESGVTPVVTVITPSGDELPAGTTQYDAKQVGTYTYRIECYNTTDHDSDPQTPQVRSSIISSYNLYCEVTGDTGSIELPENSYYVIPTEFVKGKALTAPVPTAFVNDMEVDFSSATAVTAGQSTFYEVKLEDGTYAQIKAYLTKVGANSSVEMTYNTSVGSAYNKKAHFSYAFADNDASVGTYKLVYKLYHTTASGVNVVDAEVNPVAVSNAKSIKVKSSLDADKLYISWASTPKKSAEVGVEYSLVDVNATFVEGSTDYVNAFAQITVKHQGTNEEMVVDYDKMTFVPKYKGNYYVTYKSIIPSLNVSSNILTYSILDVDDSTAPTLYLTGDYKIIDGKTYAMDGTTLLDDMDKSELLDTIGDASHYVKSYYKMQPVGGTEDYAVTVKIPAAYVLDNYSNINNIKVTRNLYQRTNTTDSGKLSLVKSESGDAYAFNEVAEYTFTTDSTTGNKKEGSYLVRYIVEDETGRSITSDFNITVKANGDTTVVGEPTLTFAYDDEMIKSDDVITFDVPSATDNYDTNLLVETYYGFVAPTVSDNKITNLDKFSKLMLSDIENNKYTLDIDEIIKSDKHKNQDHQYLYLVSYAKNDYDNNLTENKNYIVKKVLVLGASTDSDAPVYSNPFGSSDNTGYTISEFNTKLVELNTEAGSGITLDSYGYRNDGDYADSQSKEDETVSIFDQDDIVKIPDIKFTDADNFVNFEIKVSYKNGEETIELNGLESGYRAECTPILTGDPATITGYEHVLSGASFRASYAKTYTITIVATDSNGNVSFTSFAVNVNDTQPPVINIENNAKFSEDVEVGTSFTVPAPKVYDNGVIDESATWEWSLTDPNGAKYYFTSYNRTFTPTVLGTYTVQYTAWDSASNQNVSSEYRFNVVAEDAPVFVNANEIAVSLQSTEDSYAWNDNATTQTAVVIPVATAKEVNIDGSIKVDAPVVKNSKGEERTVTKTDDGQWQFTPDIQGTYTITYSAQGKYLNNNKEFSLTLGDGDAPTMEWVNKEEDLTTTVNVGDSWTFKFNMIEADDHVSDMSKLIGDILADGVTSDAITELKDYMTITMKDPNNKTVEYTIADNGLKYTFDEVGSYTFKIVLKDEAGNSTGNTYSYTITVSEEEAEEETKGSSAVGTVLIVLSVVILAGVVAYFAITTKQVDSKGKGKKTSKKDEKNDK